MSLYPLPDLVNPLLRFFINKSNTKNGRNHPFLINKGAIGAIKATRNIPSCLALSVNGP